MVTESGALAGKVVTVTGEVTAESTDGSRILSVDSSIYQDDTLLTDQGERIEVLFNDDTRLSVGENSRISVDTYVFDPADPEASAILLDAVQGTFKTITGQITEQNPENFTIKTPLATLGIRGTTVLSHVTPDHEIHGPEYIEEGKTFVLTDNFGNIRFITDNLPIKVIDVRPDEPASFQRILSQEEFLFFEQQVPMTTFEDDVTSTSGVQASTGADADADPGVPSLFGPDTDESVGLQNQAGVTQLFGPDGLPTKTENLTFDYDEPTSSAPTDDYQGFVEDSTNLNYPPVAMDVEGATHEDHQYLGTFNATDPENDPLDYTLLTNPMHGTVTINPDDTFVYTPDRNFFGTDNFTYQVEDIAGNTSSAEVNLVIYPVNDAPVAEDTSFSTAANTPLNGQLHGYDVDGDQLFYSLETAPSNGTIAINPDGSFTYTPNTGFSGSDSFQFYLDDGHGGHDIGYITITIGAGPAPPPGPGNNPPVAVNGNYTGTQGSVIIGQVTATDPDGDPITYSVSTPPTFGSIFFNPDGTFDYSTSNAALSTDYGTDTFQFTADDGQGGQSTGTVTITVAADYLGDNNPNAPPAGTPLDDVFGGLGGNDTFNGAGGNDSFIGGLGTDTLTGGAGNDTFHYTLGDGGDIITDFQSGADTLDISGTGLTATNIITGSGLGPYGGSGPTPPTAAIVIWHNTSINTWEVWYDPSLLTAGGSEVLIATLNANPITAGDITVA